MSEISPIPMTTVDESRVKSGYKTVNKIVPRVNKATEDNYGINKLTNDILGKIPEEDGEFEPDFATSPKAVADYVDYKISNMELPNNVFDESNIITDIATTEITYDSPISQVIEINSAEFTLDFVPADENIFAEKYILLKANVTTAVTYNGASFANVEEDPEFGREKYTLLLKAIWIGEKVILKVMDNSQVYFNITGEDAVEKIVSESGRSFYRHSSGMGTVMEYNDGTGVKKLLVLDRQYRNSKRFGTYNVDTSLTNYNTINGQTWGYLPSTATITEEELKNYSTTEYINNGGTTYDTYNYIYWEDTNTAKQNCDVWMTYVGQENNYPIPITGVPPVEWCRSQLVDGVPCDLPNIQQMIRIWLDREVIESLDPSITTSYKLTSSGRWWWSSTEYASNSCWHVSGVGNVGYSDKDSMDYVCPVLELNS